MCDPLKTYHRAILEVWGGPHTNEIPGFKLMPYLGQARHSEETYNDDPIEVLFLGINPSYNPSKLEDDWKEIFGQRGANSFSSHMEWSSPLALKEKIENVINFDHACRKKHRFYKPITDLAEKAGVKNWRHLDLLPLRVNGQKSLNCYLKEDEIEQPLNDLIKETIRLMSAWEPKAVVVLNALASNVLIKILKLQLQTNGHRYQTDVKGFSDTTFLLGSQLSGGATSKPASVRLLADLRDLLRGGTGLNGGDGPTQTATTAKVAKRGQAK